MRRCKIEESSKLIICEMSAENGSKTKSKKKMKKRIYQEESVEEEPTWRMNEVNYREATTPKNNYSEYFRHLKLILLLFYDGPSFC